MSERLPPLHVCSYTGSGTQAGSLTSYLFRTRRLGSQEELNLLPRFPFAQKATLTLSSNSIDQEGMCAYHCLHLRVLGLCIGSPGLAMDVKAQGPACLGTVWQPTCPGFRGVAGKTAVCSAPCQPLGAQPPSSAVWRLTCWIECVRHCPLGKQVCPHSCPSHPGFQT